MGKPFEHDGHTYTIERRPSGYAPVRDDGAIPWNTFASLRVIDGKAQPYTAAYAIWFPTITECKSFVDGTKDHGTFTFQPVWALTADDARQMREEMDNDTKSV